MPTQNTQMGRLYGANRLRSSRTRKRRFGSARRTKVPYIDISNQLQTRIKNKKIQANQKSTAPPERSNTQERTKYDSLPILAIPNLLCDSTGSHRGIYLQGRDTRRLSESGDNGSDIAFQSVLRTSPLLARFRDVRILLRVRICSCPCHHGESRLYYAHARDIQQPECPAWVCEYRSLAGMGGDCGYGDVHCGICRSDDEAAA